MTDMAMLLEAYGPWALVAILIVGIVFVYRSMSALLDKRVDQLIDVIGQSTAALEQAAEREKESTELMRRVDVHLEAEKNRRR